MTKPKVLISDKMDPNAARIFEERGCDVDVITGETPEELAARIGDYDGLAIRSSTTVTPAILDAATNLKVIGRAGIGVDNVDIPYASGKGVVVMNTPFGNSITTAEHAIAMMMALARQIPQANARTQAGEWPKKDFMGVEVTGKTLGLIGAGNIGAIVASRALGLKMKVIAYDPFLTEDRAIELGVEKVDLDTLLSRADFVTLHTPLTDETRNILSRERLENAKQGIRIVNCARGGLIDEAALKDCLESGQVAGAALDVFATEPAKESPLFGAPNFICTPHLGASTTEAQVNVALQVAEQMADYLVNGGVANALNMPSLSAEEAPKLKPYMALAERLGSLVGQLAHGNLTKISIEREGAAAELAGNRRGAGGLHAPLFRHGEHGQRALSGEGTRPRSRRSPPEPRRGVLDPDPRLGRNRSGHALGRWHAVRQGRAASGRNLRHRHRSRARRAHAVRGERRQAGFHRPHRYAAR